MGNKDEFPDSEDGYSGSVAWEGGKFWKDSYKIRPLVDDHILDNKSESLAGEGGKVGVAGDWWEPPACYYNSVSSSMLRGSMGARGLPEARWKCQKDGLQGDPETE